MDLQSLIKRPLTTEYVGGILSKLLVTIEKYEMVIPEVEEMVKEITKRKPKDQFAAVVTVLDALKKYESKSPFMKELFENVKKDFWHGLNADLPKHEGEFYVG